MTDEYKLRQQETRGKNAAELMENELIKEAFSTIEATILDAWKGSRKEDEEERNNAYLMFRLLQNFKAQFMQVIGTGKAAQKELLAINDPSKIRRIVNGR